MNKENEKIIKEMKHRIVASQIMVEWNDNPKMEVVMNDMPSDLEEAFGQWLSDIEHEKNQGEFDEVTKSNVYKIFNKACDQIKNLYMYMGHDENFYYFKHTITRNYIKIEREGEE